MRQLLTTLTLALPFLLCAQYGTFNASSVKAARNATLWVVTDGNNSAYDRAIMDAVKAEWKFTGAFDFITVGEMGTRPLDPGSIYLMKVLRNDPAKYDGVFLSVIQGWKQKKGETLSMSDGVFSNIPVEQELASLLIDTEFIMAREGGAMMPIYLKHLQDYLGLVESGKITDRTTADRTYAARTRHVRDTELVLSTTQLDAGLGGQEGVSELYSDAVRVVEPSALIAAARAQDRGTTIADVVITGEYKTKHCFKRLFNANTGELMYHSDTAALHGKKEGFIADDIKAVARAR